MVKSEWLDALQLRRPQSRRLALSAPWGTHVPGGRGPGMYLLPSGIAHLLLPGQPPLAMAAGDVVVLPQGIPHALASEPTAPLRPMDECLGACHGEASALRGGGSGAVADLHALCFDIADPTAQTMLGFAPQVLVIRGPTASTWFSHIRNATVELLDSGTGEPAIQARLGELVLAEALSTQPAQPMTNREDLPILKAVLLLRTHLGQRWTIGRLARQVGQSRSAFYSHFVRVMGCPPAQYLLRARMEEAMVQLRAGGRSDTVSAAVGYRAPTAFSAAFRVDP